MPFDGTYDTVMLAREILSATPHPLRQLVPDLPLHVEAAITQALAKDKGLRFPSVLDFVRALHGLPLSSTVQLRRDAPAAPLLYNERPTAALLDYSDRPTAALLDYSDRPTAALPLGPDHAAVVASAYSPPAELTALLPAVPVSPSRPSIFTASAQTPARSCGKEGWRWRRLAAVLSLVAVGATAGLMLSRGQPEASASGQAAAPLLDSAAVGATPAPPWTPAGEPATAAASIMPGLFHEPRSSCSCAPPVPIVSSAACPPVSPSASPAPGRHPPSLRRKAQSKFPLSTTAVSRYLRRLD